MRTYSLGFLSFWKVMRIMVWMCIGRKWSKISVAPPNKGRKGLIMQGEAMNFFFFHCVGIFTILHPYADSTVWDVNLHRGHGGPSYPSQIVYYAMIKMSPTWYKLWMLPLHNTGTQAKWLEAWKVYLKILEKSADEDGVKEKLNNNDYSKVSYFNMSLYHCQKYINYFSSLFFKLQVSKYLPNMLFI